MKITVEISDSELKELRKLTGERKKGPAIRKVVVDALKLRRRREMNEKFLSGEWGVELKGYEEAQKKDKEDQEEMERRWRRSEPAD
jgi:hypothetical protein